MGQLEKQDHYPVLDGLRGFAAISVVLFHLGHWLNVPFLVPNASRAVDFFFCLSGFVLARAYGMQAKPGLQAAKFCSIRLIRLVPLIVLGTLVSAAYVAFRLVVTHQHAGFHTLPLAVLLGLTSLPYLHAPAVLGGPQVFPLNGPQYTLFLEFLINFIWFYGRPIPQFVGALVIAVPCIVLLAMFGTGGDTTASFWHGFPRVGASYFIGVAIFETSQRIEISPLHGRIFWCLAAAMVALFFAPFHMSRAADIIWIAVISPALVLTGARIPAAGAFKILCLFSGRISYPVYILQYPIFCWVNGITQTILHRRIDVLEVPLCFVAILGLSTIAMQLYDEPLRRRLTAAARRPRAAIGQMTAG